MTSKRDWHLRFDSVVRRLVRTGRSLPYKPFKKSLLKLYGAYAIRQSDRSVQATIEGITYELDLNEVIDSALYYLGSHEPATTATMRHLLRPGMTVFDVGANMGYFTLNFAKLVGEAGRVIAFEPTTWALEKLHRNMSLNNFSNITVEQVALSDIQEEREVEPSERAFKASWALSGPSQRSGREIVRFMPLDAYMAMNPIGRLDLMKIDVDGYEYRVVRGATETMRTHSPVVIIEIGKSTMAQVGDRPEKLTALLAELGYSFLTDDGQHTFSSGTELLDWIPYQGANVLCVPANKRNGSS